MYIQTEETPNPRTLKFLPNRDVAGATPMTFGDSEQAKVSNLASLLFNVEGVESVFLGSDFISVSRKADFEWTMVKAKVITAIMEHFVSGKPVFTTSDEKKEEVLQYDPEDPIIKEIIELIDARVRPAVAEDGGDIIFRNFKDGIVYLEMQGACSGCPSSTVTLKNGVESMLKHYIPEVLEVQQFESGDEF
jgi:Fe-S cluster biogenesis protein NfuA